MDLEIIKSNLDGFGGRLNKVEMHQARHDERIKDNKEAIINLRESVNQIKNAITGAIWKILAAVSIPTMLLLYQLISQANK